MDTFSLYSTIASITPDRAWGIDISNYFWFTGSSDAAYIIASLALVFGVKKFKPIAGFSLLLALALLIAAVFNLIDDLEQPGRLMNFFLYGWENFASSPMKWGVLLLMAYPILIFFQLLVLYRVYFVKKIQSKKGFTRLYALLTLGRIGLENDDLEKDERLSFILASIGIPLAVCVHGYTGYILGIVHANALWSTPLMPILFLASALISGTGLMILLLPIFQKFFSISKSIDFDIMRLLGTILSWFIVADLILRAIWLSFAMPFAGETRVVLEQFFSMHASTELYFDYILCLIVPMLIGFTKLKNSLFALLFSGFIAALGVWFFRWNTVVGGETLPKSMPGFLQYFPQASGHNSILALSSNWLLFVAVLAFIAAIFPWDEEMEDSYKGANYGKK